MLKFYYNGIKEDGGKLQKCSYYGSAHLNCAEGTIMIYAKHYRHFSDGVSKAFTVENDSDSMTDYFEDDRIRVEPSHPLYADVKAAYEKQEAKRQARYIKRQVA